MIRKGLIFIVLTVIAASLVTASLSGCAKKKQEVVIEELEATAPAAQEAFKLFDVYSDKASPSNHYIPSGWMGDWGDIKVDDRYMDNPHGGTTCIKIEYLPKRSQGAGWMGMYWQNPANNWGSKKAGFDLTGAKKLIFWARGDKGNEIISEFKMGGITGEFSDSDSAGIGPAKLSQEWKEFSINLEGRDLSHIIGGFCLSANYDDNPDGFVIYLDDIKYE